MPCLGSLSIRHIFWEHNQKQARGQRETQVFVGSTDEQHPFILAAHAGAEAKKHEKAFYPKDRCHRFLDNILFRQYSKSDESESFTEKV